MNIVHTGMYGYVLVSTQQYVLVCTHQSQYGYVPVSTQQCVLVCTHQSHRVLDINIVAQDNSNQPTGCIRLDIDLLNISIIEFSGQGPGPAGILPVYLKTGWSTYSGLVATLFCAC